MTQAQSSTALCHKAARGTLVCETPLKELAFGLENEESRKKCASDETVSFCRSHFA